jgi:hypothetical protein
VNEKLENRRKLLWLPHKLIYSAFQKHFKMQELQQKKREQLIDLQEQH